ncbi:hypothetical protein OU998_07950 [Brevundimonas sp. SL130]|nr:hypothetical protein [Brevundimonas sp. SL130]WAC61361.1 hypothetical protein OU998_07950 [Brevundimonas sp. SL130]
MRQGLGHPPFNGLLGDAQTLGDLGVAETDKTRHHKDIAQRFWQPKDDLLQKKRFVLSGGGALIAPIETAAGLVATRPTTAQVRRASAGDRQQERARRPDLNGVAIKGHHPFPGLVGDIVALLAEAPAQGPGQPAAVIAIESGQTAVSPSDALALIRHGSASFRKEANPADAGC